MSFVAPVLVLEILVFETSVSNKQLLSLSAVSGNRTWMSYSFGAWCQVVLVGDHCQLGPVIMCKKTARAGLSLSEIIAIWVQSSCAQKQPAAICIHGGLPSTCTYVFVTWCSLPGPYGSWTIHLMARACLLKKQTNPTSVSRLPAARVWMLMGPHMYTIKQMWCSGLAFLGSSSKCTNR